MKISNGMMEQYLKDLEECRNATGFAGMIIGITHRRISSEIQEYILEKQKIFEKYGQKTESGGWNIPYNSPNFEKAISEISAISEIESEIDIPQFSEDDFIEKFQDKILTAKNYDVLYRIFVE